MSIPKEPRQLMINIMYIVLTAMLALNVSVEILNAFQLLDGELNRSSEVIDNQNKKIPSQIAKFAKKDWNQFEQYAIRADEIRTVSQEFVDSIDALIEILIDKSGNKNGVVDDEDYIFKFDEDGNEISKKYRGEKDKDIATRILVGNSPDSNNGKGADLEMEIEDYRFQLLNFFDKADRAKWESKIILEVDNDWEDSDKLNWAHHNFYQMPLGAVVPMLSKIKYDMKASENVVLNYLLEKVGASDAPVINKFEAVSSPIKTYIIAGEKFKTEIFLGATDLASSGLKISVDGRTLPVKNGKAKYSINANENGIHKYKVESSIYNPVTNVLSKDERTFEYEVGERVANVAATKMNVIYVGVENPLRVAAAGVPSESIKLSSKDIQLKKISPFEYMATATTPMKEAIISVTGDGLEKTDFVYRIKKISSPVPIVGAGSNKTGGIMGNAEFKAQLGLGTMMKNFEWDINCKVQSFELARQSKRLDPVVITNYGARYSASATRLIQQAKPGDTFYFDNIKVKCPGDKVSRSLSSIVFRIR